MSNDQIWQSHLVMITNYCDNWERTNMDFDQTYTQLNSQNYYVEILFKKP